jgi:hypothetical protein
MDVVVPGASVAGGAAGTDAGVMMPGAAVCGGCAAGTDADVVVGFVSVVVVVLAHGGAAPGGGR